MRRILFLIPLALLILLAGCQQQGASSSGNLYTGGTNGLLISLVDQAPPSLIYDSKQTPFDMIVQAKNDGEFDVGWITFTINGISPDDFENLLAGTEDVTPVQRAGDGKTFLVYATPDNPILGKTKLGEQTLPGEERLITLAKDVAYTKELTGGGTLSFPYYISACYPYATLATIQLCTKTNYLTGDNKVCDPATLKQMSVSAGPLQLVDYKQQAVGSKRLRLTLTFKLKDNSGIYKPKAERADIASESDVTREVQYDTLQTCQPSTLSEELQEKGYFYAIIDLSDMKGVKLRCSGLREDPSAANGAEAVLKTVQPNFASGKSINIRIIISTSPGRSEARKEGLVRLNPDGTATLTCTADFSNADVPTDAIRPARIATVYYVRQDVAGNLQVTHSES